MGSHAGGQYASQDSGEMRAVVTAFVRLASSYLDVNRALASELNAGDPSLSAEAVASGLISGFPVELDYGEEEGDECRRNGCGGIIGHHKHGGSCVCHLGRPPCGWCTSGYHACSSCDWSEHYSC